jgi:hypothetical protein
MANRKPLFSKIPFRGVESESPKVVIAVNIRGSVIDQANAPVGYLRLEQAFGQSRDRPRRSR